MVRSPITCSGRIHSNALFTVATSQHRAGGAIYPTKTAPSPKFESSSKRRAKIAPPLSRAATTHKRRRHRSLWKKSKGVGQLTFLRPVRENFGEDSEERDGKTYAGFQPLRTAPSFSRTECSKMRSVTHLFPIVKGLSSLQRHPWFWRQTTGI